MTDYITHQAMNGHIMLTEAADLLNTKTKYITKYYGEKNKDKKMKKFIIDSNVFIQSKNFHYQFSFCSMFWDFLVEFHKHVVLAMALPET